MLGYAYSHHMGWGWGIFMTLGFLLLLALLVGVVLSVIRDRRGNAPTSREILDRRLASGEISVEEYGSAREAMFPAPAERTPADPGRGQQPLSEGVTAHELRHASP